MMRVQLVVEGHGERSASQLLVRRILQERLQVYDVDLPQPQRRTDVKSLLAKDGCNLVRFQRVAEGEADAVLWLLDHDDGCVLESLNSACGILKGANVLRPTAFAFIPREYETLFLEEAESCGAYFGCEPNILLAGRYRRDAKGYISGLLPRGRAYKPTTDQPSITANLQLNRLAEVSPAYRHLERSVRWLLDVENAEIYPIKGSVAK